ncbi:MAG: hypothetical protein CML06_19035 [Pseudomonadales bacterium]|mgnify:CR=1 FL=1|nr:hypothetical protein [Pseudomonadales bacterium]
MPLDQHLRYFEDPSGSRTIAELRDDPFQGRWQSQSEEAFNQGYSQSAWWLTLRLENPMSQPVESLLELGYAVLDQVDVYVYSGPELVRHYAMGDLQPFSERPVIHRFFVIPLQWAPGETLDIYYRIKTSTSVQAPPTLWQRDLFEERENQANIAQGLYYGAMLVIAVYNLLIFLVLWDRSYLYYVAFVLSVPLFMASISGQAYHYLWPQAVVWNDHSIPFFLALAFATSALFTRRFLRVRQWSVWLYYGLGAVAVAGFGCLLLSFVAPYVTTIHLLVPLGLFACLFEMAVGIASWVKRVPTARYYVIAWLSFLAGGTMLALNKLNILPANFITEYGIQLGSVLEAVLLSFAMAQRITEERRLCFAAQDEALSATIRLKQELEDRVRQRTRELEQLNSKLQDLTNTDQLTGLRNRRFMDEVMLREWSRCRRYQHDFALAMIDVDFFKRFNDEFGYPAGDACLQQVAERLGGCVRWPSDQLARYGREEFCLVLPETDASGALVVAERIREAVAAQPIITEHGEFSVTVSVGVCVGRPAKQPVSAALKSADMALYQSKNSGRNRVTLFHLKDLDNVCTLSVKRPPRD